MAEPLSMDQKFIARLTEIVLSNLTDENLTVTKLAKEAGMSHASLHRKLRSVKNQDVSQFIREIRLKKAVELLRLNAGTASEIAFMVGFGSPAYFIKCFHEHYGVTPGEFKKSHALQLDQVDQPPKEELTPPDHEKARSGISRFSRARVNRLFAITAAVALTATITILLLLYMPVLKEYNRSVIVLPFKDLSEPPDNQHLADGIMEEILNSLFQVSQLRVISRTTSEYFIGKNFTVREISRKTNARYVLESSVRQDDDKFRLTVQLIDARFDRHLWSENIDRNLTDLISLQASVATQVALKLKVTLPDTELRNIEKTPTRSPEAYDNYLRGRFMLNKAVEDRRIDITREGLTGSIEFFEKAIEADTSFSEAYACMASAYLRLAGWGWYQPASEGYLKAKELTIKALAINPNCPRAHAVKGSYHMHFERDFEEARRELLLALKSSSTVPPAYQNYAQLLMITGPIEEARVYMDNAMELEPYYWVLHNLNALIYYFERKHGKAIEACLTAQTMNPDYNYTNWLLFLNYSKLGEGEKASGELKTIAGLCSGTDDYTDDISRVYEKSGIPGLYEWLTEININNPLPATGLNGHPFPIAWWYAILGDREKSIYWLERNMETKNRMYEFFNLIGTNPDFDILRDDPRFNAIIDKIGLTPYNVRKAR